MRVNQIGCLQSYSVSQNKKQNVSFQQESSFSVGLLKTVRDFAVIGFFVPPISKVVSKDLNFVPNYVVLIAMGLCLVGGLFCHYRSKALEARTA